MSERGFSELGFTEPGLLLPVVLCLLWSYVMIHLPGLSVVIFLWLIGTKRARNQGTTAAQYAVFRIHPLAPQPRRVIHLYQRKVFLCLCWLINTGKKLSQNYMGVFKQMNPLPVF